MVAGSILATKSNPTITSLPVAGETNLRSTVRKRSVRSISDSYISFPLLVIFLSFSEKKLESEKNKKVQEKFLESEKYKKVPENFLESEKKFQGKMENSRKFFQEKIGDDTDFLKRKN